MRIHALGPFRLDPRNSVLLHGTEPVALGQRAVALLQALMDQPGELVSKEALIEAAWPGLAVADNNLTVQIAALRRALGAAPGGERWIETLPRRGYRFVGPIVASEKRAITPPPVEAPHEDVPIAPGEAERRQVSAMFCELIRTAGRAGGMDLEDLREAVVEFRRSVAETAARHAGFLYRLLGSHVLVLFGYPEAYEDDAERAIRAGLELCATVRALRLDTDAPMQCRAGVATATVIIDDSVEAETLQSQGVVGDVLGAAARLCASAPPDTMAIDPATRRLIGNLFDCRELGARETNGGTVPAPGWLVERESLVASRFEALRGAALTPLVGRGDEIDLVLRRWAHARAGNGQILLVSGEPGIGKSRLGAALEERLQDEPHLCLRFFCSPHCQDSALFPSIDQLGRAAGFARDDPPATRLEKLEAVLAHAEPPDEDVALLADLLSVPASERHKLPTLSAQKKKEKTLEALIRQLEGLARRQPILMIFEDAQWIDPTSRELLDLIIERLRSLPALLIVTFRPEFEPPWTGQTAVTTLALTRLDRHDQSVLARQIAGGKALPGEVLARIADRTDGVPLFVEELTRSILEGRMLREERDRYILDGAISSAAIPASLHSSLMARLDRLGSARSVARTGAAIGRQFSYTLLRAVACLPDDKLQAALERLVSSELVFRRGTPPEAVYTFKHALVQDAAYGSLLRKTRRQLHARIANALETDSPELMDSQPELLARHYSEGGLVEKSVTYWAKAGHRSTARSAMAEAAAQLQKGLDQLALLPDSPDRRRQELEFCSALGAALSAAEGYAALETGCAYARARELWEQLGSSAEFRQVPYGQSRYYALRGEFDQAQSLADDLLRFSCQRNDSAGLVLGHYCSGRNLMYMGNFVRSQSHLETALALYDSVSHGSLARQTGTNPQTASRGILGIDMLILGYPDHALACSASAIAEDRSSVHPPSLANDLAVRNIVLSLVGDDRAMNECADELVALAAEQGFPLWSALGATFRGWAKAKTGDVAEGMSLLQNGATALHATGADILMPYFLTLLARAFECAGHIAEALIQLEDALRIVERTGERWFEAEINRHQGRLLLCQGRPGDAEERYRKALGIARKQQAKMWELRAAVSLARLHRNQGRCAEACDLLVPVHGWFTEGFATPDLKEAKALLDQLT